MEPNIITTEAALDQGITSYQMRACADHHMQLYVRMDHDDPKRKYHLLATRMLANVARDLYAIEEMEGSL